MLIKDVYSFIDIEPAHFEQVFNAFKGANHKGRKVRVDEAQGAQAAPRTVGPGGYRAQSGPARQGALSGGPRKAPPPKGGQAAGPRGGFARKKEYHEPKPRYAGKGRR
jgi:hypothetical protein